MHQRVNTIDSERNVSPVKRRLIPDVEAIPVIETDIFRRDKVSSELAIVSLGFGMYPDSETEDIFRNYLRLRANVYIKQTQMISPSALRADGTEYDEAFDFNSYHHVALARGKVDGTAEVVGSLCVAPKTSSDHPLEAEIEFPEYFKNHPLDVGSNEIKRFIAKKKPLTVINGLFTNGLATVRQKGLTTTIGVVEPPLMKSLAAFGAPPKQLTDFIYVPGYQGYNAAVEINVDEMDRIIGRDILKVRNNGGDTVHYSDDYQREVGRAVLMKIDLSAGGVRYI